MMASVALALRGRQVVITAVLTGAVALLVTPGTAVASGCVAGVHQSGSVKARTFCGPASVVLNLGGKKVALRGGQCTRTSSYVAVNIGTVVLGTSNKPAPNYFGIDVGKTPGGGSPAPHDGTYKAFALSFAVGGKLYSSLSATATLKNGRTRGTFSGKLLAGGSASGAFKCS